MIKFNVETQIYADNKTINRKYIPGVAQLSSRTSGRVSLDQNKPKI